MPDVVREQCPKCRNEMLHYQPYGTTTEVECYACGLRLYIGPRETLHEAWIRRQASDA